MNFDPPIVQVAHASFVWAAELSCEVAPDHEASPGLALVRAFAAEGPDGGALQLRYEPGRPGPLLVGRGRTADDGRSLAQLARLTMPSTHRLAALGEDDIRARLVPFALDDIGPRHLAEVRRVADVAEDGRAVLVAWPCDASGVELGPLLDRSPAGTLLCLHLERATVDADVLSILHATVQDLLDDLGTAADPARGRALIAHRAWLRELPRAAVELRVTLVAEHPLAPGLADLIGLAVAGTTPGEIGLAYETIRPRSPQEVDLALQLVDDVRAGRWGATDDVELDRLRPLFGSVEAAAAFRFPSLPSTPARPLDTIPDGEAVAFEPPVRHDVFSHASLASSGARP